MAEKENQIKEWEDQQLKNEENQKERQESFRMKVEAENQVIEEKQTKNRNDLEIEKQRVMQEYKL